MKFSAAATLTAVIAVAACDSGQDTREPERTEGPRGPDLARGELLSLACQACHTLARDGANLVGPNLHGVFGRRAGSAAEFAYSPALAAAEIVWTPETLDAWLADPVGFLPGTTMAFAGYQSARDREDLITYLVNATK